MDNNIDNGRSQQQAQRRPETVPMDKVSLVDLVRQGGEIVLPAVPNPAVRRPVALEEMFRPTSSEERRISLQQTLDQVIASLQATNPNEDDSSPTDTNDKQSRS